MKCIKCQKAPDQIDEYVEAASDLGIRADQYVRIEEGTFDRRTGFFCCTNCYIELGMPLIPELLAAYSHIHDSHKNIGRLS